MVWGYYHSNAVEIAIVLSSFNVIPVHPDSKGVGISHFLPRDTIPQPFLSRRFLRCFLLRVLTFLHVPPLAAIYKGLARRSPVSAVVAVVVSVCAKAAAQ